MPKPSPFHERTSELCRSLNWKDWAGYHAVVSYQEHHEQEYFAFRHAAGLMDATPLFKYEIKGPDAVYLLNRVMAKEISRLAEGRVTYCCWCDDDGKVLDDGTVSRLGKEHFRITAAEPFLHWFILNSRSLNVSIEDITSEYGMLALQGPLSREIIARAAGEEASSLGFFRLMRGSVGGRDVTITRTGYTGDLGYEIWCRNADALAVYDTLMDRGRDHQLMPAGLAALDVARVEAGFIMNGVDYFSANHCLTHDRKSTPYELGLGWSVDLDRENFIGRDALKREKANGSRWRFVGLEYDWDAFEAIFAKFDLPPETPAGAWRTPVPVFGMDGEQIGQATSGAWSPTLKKNLALASLRSGQFRIGERVQIEVTAEYERKLCPATVAEPMFYDPKRKRA
ncbi:MAG: aminomethyl transferase family protein [Acidobacteriota bacterium]|nr:MAG: aminomethyl transferase family protein [Acidobacteriota bacterium]